MTATVTETGTDDYILETALAQAIGWKPFIIRGTDTSGRIISKRRWNDPRGIVQVWPPSYCDDRNALPEIWAAIESAGQSMGFVLCLTQLMGTETSVWLYLQAEPRLHVIAALRALGAWKDEWDKPESWREISGLKGRKT